jgi:hypothetical protein
LQAIRRSLSGRGTGQIVRTQPAVPLTVELDPLAFQRLEEARNLDAVRDCVAAAVGYKLQALGLSGEPRAELRPLADGPDGSAGFRLRVHGRPYLQPAAQVAEILRQAGGPGCRSVADLPSELLGPGLAALCTGAIHRRPSLLLANDQLRYYRETIGGLPVNEPGLGWPPGEERLRAVLVPVLDAGVSIADTRVVASVVSAGEIDAIPPGHVAERIVDSQRHETVRILLNRETLRSLTTQDAEPTEAFVRLRERLHVESGALFPNFVFTETTELAPGMVAFGLNALTTLPTPLPDSDPLLAVADRLATELRAHRSWFASIGVLNDRLDQLEFLCPDLVAAARDRYPIEWLAAVARALFREDVRTPSLKDILEHLLDLDQVGDAVNVVRLAESVATSAAPAIGSLPAPRDVVSYLRQRANEKLQETFLIWQQASFIRLDDETERMAEDLAGRADPQPGQQAEVILAAVRRLIAAAPGSAGLAVRSVPVRSFLRELLEPEFPLIPVVATQEYGILADGALSPRL